MLISCRTDSDAICILYLIYHTYHIPHRHRGFISRRQDGDLWVIAGAEGDSSTWEYIGIQGKEISCGCTSILSLPCHPTGLLHSKLRRTTTDDRHMCGYIKVHLGVLKIL